MRIRCVLFDLDGTLLDTVADLTAACNAALGGLGAPLRSLEEVRGMVGDGVRKLMERALPPERAGQIETASELFRAYYAAHPAVVTTPYPGISELLDTLRLRGYRLGIVSNKPQYAVDALIRRFFPAVGVAIGDRAGRRVKPAPDNCFAALARLGEEAENCVYVGDSDVDLSTAAALGTPCVAAAWGFRGADFLRRHGARYIADTPGDVLAQLARVEIDC